MALYIIPIGKKSDAPFAHFGSCVIGIDSVMPFALTIIEANVHTIPHIIIRIIIKKIGNFGTIFLLNNFRSIANAKGATAINKG